jgi:hypothetical protein
MPMQVLKSTQNGQILYCPRHDLLQLEFGNIHMHISYNDLNQLADYVSSINHDFYLKKNKKTMNRRKILLHIGSERIYLALTRNEFLELRDLVSFKSDAGLIDNMKLIDFTSLLN